MSGRLVSSVLESALESWLKPFAVAFASFANEKNGMRVWPSVGSVAKMLGRSTRQARRATSELRRRGILECLVPHDRYHPTEYRFHAERLPQDFHISTGVNRYQQDTDVRSDRTPVSSDP